MGEGRGCDSGPRCSRAAVRLARHLRSDAARRSDVLYRTHPTAGQAHKRGVTFSSQKKKKRKKGTRKSRSEFDPLASVSSLSSPIQRLDAITPMPRPPPPLQHESLAWTRQIPTAPGKGKPVVFQPATRVVRTKNVAYTSKVTACTITAVPSNLFVMPEQVPQAVDATKDEDQTATNVSRPHPEQITPGLTIATR